MAIAQSGRPQTHPLPDPTRVLNGALTHLERRCLVAMASRMPRWIHADHLTGLALVAMLGAGAAYAWARVSPAGLVAAVLCLAVNWFGDSLDGTLARVRHHERPRYGFYVDHVVDTIGATALLVGLAFSGYMHPVVAIGLLVAYLLLASEIFLATYSVGTFTISYAGVGPTELRLLLALGSLVSLVHPMAHLGRLLISLFDLGGLIGTAGLVVVFVTAVGRHASQLYRLEPRPQA